MHLSAIQTQKLRHHAVAALACDNAGMLLLATGEKLEMTVFGHVPALMARDEFAARLLRGRLGHTGRMREICSLLPSPLYGDGAAISVYAAEYSPRMLAAMENADLALVAAEALPELRDLLGMIPSEILPVLTGSFLPQGQAVPPSVRAQARL